MEEYIFLLEVIEIKSDHFNFVYLLIFFFIPIYIRPSIIDGSLKGPCSGWLENISALTFINLFH